MGEPRPLLKRSEKQCLDAVLLLLLLLLLPHVSNSSNMLMMMMPSSLSLSAVGLPWHILQGEREADVCHGFARRRRQLITTGSFSPSLFEATAGQHHGKTYPPRELCVIITSFALWRVRASLSRPPPSFPCASSHQTRISIKTSHTEPDSNRNLFHSRCLSLFFLLLLLPPGGT